MKKRLVCIGLALALLAGLSLTAAAEDLELPAPSCILMEKQTGQVLYESNAHEKLRPASVTKVMTLLLVMEALESGSIGWDDTVTDLRRGRRQGRQPDLSRGKRAAAADGDAQVGRRLLRERLCLRAGRARGRERGSLRLAHE
ncbi:MAG: serine hydrolase [Oscillospiraceae bacterium]